MKFACGFHEWHWGPYGEIDNSRVAGSIPALANIQFSRLRECLAVDNRRYGPL